MKKDKANTCPGCGNHCPECALRCKYGRNYFAKMRKAEQGPVLSPCAQSDKKRRKWEKYVAAEGPVWKLLTASRRTKKILLKKEMTEDQLLASLTEAEKQTLSDLLDKLCPVTSA